MYRIADNGVNEAFRIGPIRFSRIEIRDLVKSWLAISFAFGNILGGIFSFIGFLVAALTVGVGFIAHELAHKVLAQKYGAWAEFRSSNQMLILAVLMSFFGFVFAAPGAVVIAGRTIGRNRNGLIAAVGPLVSFVIGLCFLPLIILGYGGIIGMIGSYGFTINIWLGLFNLIPFAMFDGKKIWDWNKAAWIGLLVFGIGLFMLTVI